MNPNNPQILDAVKRAHEYLVNAFHGEKSQVQGVSIAEDCDDIFLWVKEDGKTPTPRLEAYGDDIDVFETSKSNMLGLTFQLFADGASSEYSVECTYYQDTGKVVIEDLHVL